MSVKKVGQNSRQEKKQEEDTSNKSSENKLRGILASFCKDFGNQLNGNLISLFENRTTQKEIQRWAHNQINVAMGMVAAHNEKVFNKQLDKK